MDRLLSMEVFLKVAQLGSFSSAAGQLSMSKSTVSKHVTALEARLGLRLLNRTTRRLSLTETGEVYKEHCLRVAEAVEDADRSVTRFVEAPRGRLKVNAPMSFGLRHLSPLVPRFLEEHPEIEIELMLNDRRVELIDEGFDVAVRIGQLDDSSLIAKRLAASRMVCAASPDYVRRRRAPLHPDDLTRHDCLRYSYSRTPSEWTFIKDGRSVRVRIDGRYAANNGDVLREAAMAGLGIVCQPLFLIGDELQSGQLVQLLTDWSTPDVVVHAVYPPARHISPKLRVFLDFLATALRKRLDFRTSDGAGK